MINNLPFSIGKTDSINKITAIMSSLKKNPYTVQEHPFVSILIMK